MRTRIVIDSTLALLISLSLPAGIALAQKQAPLDGQAAKGHPKFHSRDRDKLQGPVRTLTQESAAPMYQAGQWVEGPRQFRHVTTYDPNGNEIEYASGDYKTVLTYDANGQETGSIRYMKGDEQRKEITTYSATENKVTWAELAPDGTLRERLVTIYDANGNEVERFNYRGSKLLLKHHYVYDAAGREVEEVQDWGGNVQKTRRTFSYDEKGNLIETKHYELDDVDPDITAYAYETFDSHGNWTKRIVKNTTRYGHDYFTVEYRTFTYHS